MVKLLSQKIGRPKVENPKTIRYSICLDFETQQRLNAYCEEQKITKGEAIRKGIELLLKRKKK